MKALSQKRRHPLAAIALLLMGLLLTGGLYAVATTVNQAKADLPLTATRSILKKFAGTDKLPRPLHPA